MRLLPLCCLTLITTSCSNEIDNLFSRNNSVIEITPSTDYIKLDETKPNETALTLNWTPAHDYGNDFITTYKYEIQLSGSAADEIKEYEDNGSFTRSYTNKELQDILVNNFGQTTSTLGVMNFTVTASFEGPRLVVPDIATSAVKVKTYGAKQFKADKLYISGTAVGDNKIELTKSADDSLIYNYTGKLTAGSVNFPVTNFDESNAIGPNTANVQITDEDMTAVISDESAANFWIIPNEDTYKVTVNLKAHTVKIISASSLVALDSLFIAGTAIPNGSEIKVERTLENDNVYAWRGTLNAGTLYMPVMYQGTEDYSIVPKDASSHSINDGKPSSFAQAATSTAAQNRYFTIPSEGTYRIVFNLDNKTLTIYSSATDLKSTVVSWNNTTLGINPYSTTVEKLWMYGTFNGFAHDAGVYTGYQDAYTLKQSVANPNVFVYKGSELPKSSGNDERGTSVKGSMKFTVDNTNNNVYAYGSSASAKRNSYNGYITVTDNTPQKLVAGQSDNRYAYFIIPDGCNFVVVDIENLTVKFDKK